MASKKDITLRQGDATPKDIVLYELPVSDVVSTTIYLYQGDATARDVVLRDPTAALSAGGQVNYTLTCAAGAYTYSGQPATLLVAHSLACGTGAYTYTGNAATLEHINWVNYVLSCDVGSYVYAGQNVTFFRGYSLDCNTGVYTYNGVDASFLLEHSITCDTGSYIYEGSNAGLNYSSGLIEEARHASSMLSAQHIRRRMSRGRH